MVPDLITWVPRVGYSGIYRLPFPANQIFLTFLANSSSVNYFKSLPFISSHPAQSLVNEGNSLYNIHYIYTNFASFILTLSLRRTSNGASRISCSRSLHGYNTPLQRELCVLFCENAHSIRLSFLPASRKY